jgi:hypothetical protein
MDACGRFPQVVCKRSYPSHLKTPPVIIGTDNKTVLLAKNRPTTRLFVAPRQLQQAKLDENEQRTDDNDADRDEPPGDLEDDPPDDEDNKHPNKSDQQLREAQPGDPAACEPADQCKW